jgi:hypothetical protein
MSYSRVKVPIPLLLKIRIRMCTWLCMVKCHVMSVIAMIAVGVLCDN